MEIRHPRRILLLTPTPPDAALQPLFKVFPHPSSPSLELASNQRLSKIPPLEPISFPETFRIVTAYYTANIPLWHSPLPDDIQAWKQEWSDMEGAGEVVKEIGAWIVGFEKYDQGMKGVRDVRDMLQAVHKVVEYHMGKADPYDELEPPLLLAVGLPGSGVGLVANEEDWDDLCRECGGWEYIDGGVEAKGKSNGYGETLGLLRILEALEANEWDSSTGRTDIPHDSELSPSFLIDSLSSKDETDLPDASLGDIIGEIGPGLRRPLLETSTIETRKEELGEEDVAELESLMSKMQAIREHSADLPPTARKAFAARAVRDILGSK